MEDPTVTAVFPGREERISVSVTLLWRMRAVSPTSMAAPARSHVAFVSQPPRAMASRALAGSRALLGAMLGVLDPRAAH
jgi:hypothetical protein